MSFDRYPKKQQIVSEISIKFNQAYLGILLTNQITEFMKLQYLQNASRDEIPFLYVYISKEATMLRNAQIVLKVHTRYFQNE